MGNYARLGSGVGGLEHINKRLADKGRMGREKDVAEWIEIVWRGGEEEAV